MPSHLSSIILIHSYSIHCTRNNNNQIMTKRPNDQKVVIIGSGLGGLSCGVILAKNGYDVTILEQERQIGGCLQCFYRGGAKFETGMHFVGSASEGQTLRRLMHYLEIDDVSLSRLDPEGYEVVSLQGERFAFANGRERFIERLAERFPHQRKELERFYDVVEQVASASSLHSLRHTETDAAVNTQYLLRSIDDVVAEIITDPLLQKVIVGNLPLYAAERGKTPFSTYAFVMDFYSQSAYRVVGGSDRLAIALQAALERHGGRVLTRQRAVSIDCNDSRATGVTCADGTRYEADIVISAIHPARTLELVSSPLLRPAYRKRIQSIPNTVGGFAVYVRFKEGTTPYMNYNFYGYCQDTPWDCEQYDDATWPKGYLYMHFCDEDGQQYAKSGVILSYMHMDDVKQWAGTKSGRRGEDYEMMKHERAERLLSVVEKDFPGLRQQIASYYTSTPLTYLDYTGTEGGSMYGVAKDIHLGPAARVHHRTKIPNLLLSGQNINSHGILGVLVGTMVTCGELLTSERLFQEITNTHPNPRQGRETIQGVEVVSCPQSTAPCSDKTPSSSDKVPCSKDNGLIIGGGLGGLFAGALMAKEGFRVTVIEKNRVIGGGLQTFYRHGVGFETGMHLLGGIRPGGSIYKICRYLGIMDQMDIRDVDHDCMDQITYFSDGKTYRIPEGKEAFIRYFQQEFPHEAEGIRQYVDALYALVNEIDFFYLRTGNAHVYTHDEQFLMPADEIVNHYLHDPKLRDVISYMNPMFGGYAGHTPGFIHALINVLYINGASRFAGNSQQMAEALARIITDGGGEIVSGDPVARIDIDEQRREVSGVVTRNGRRFTADHYIAAIHPKAMLQLTDSKIFPKAYRQRINEAPNSYSSFCVYVVFKPGTFPFINHTCYYQADYGMVWHYDQYDEHDWPRGFLYMTPSEREQGPYATKMIINSIMPYEVCRPWEETQTGRRGADYEQWKAGRIECVLDVMERLYPGFRDTIGHVFASSPLTIRDFYNEPDGALYGLHKDAVNIAESQVPVYTKARNLLMTGQCVNLHGFCGVPLTAINTVEAIVGQDVITNKINAYDRENPQ